MSALRLRVFPSANVQGTRGDRSLLVGYEYQTALYNLSRRQRKGRLPIVNGRKDNEVPSLNGASVLDSSVDAAVIRASFNNIVV